METVGSYQAKTHLPQLLERVEHGETFTITRHGKPIGAFFPLRLRLSSLALPMQSPR